MEISTQKKETVSPEQIYKRALKNPVLWRKRKPQDSQGYDRLLTKRRKLLSRAAY